MSETAYARRMRHRESRGRWLRSGTKYRYQARPLAWYDATDPGCWRTSEHGRTIQAALQDAIQKMGYSAADVATQLRRQAAAGIVMYPPTMSDMFRSGYRAAAEHEQRLAGTPGPICPECKAGQHLNCDGTAWDTDRDQRTDCGCFLTSPIEHGS